MNFVQAAQELAAGRSVSGRPSGHSMTPIIRHKDLVTLRPLTAEEPLVGQVVLVRLKGRYLLHRVGALERGKYRIENARGHVNGWATRAAIAGVVETG